MSLKFFILCPKKSTFDFIFSTKNTTFFTWILFLIMAHRLEQVLGQIFLTFCVKKIKNVLMCVHNTQHICVVCCVLHATHNTFVLCVACLTFFTIYFNNFKNDRNTNETHMCCVSCWLATHNTYVLYVVCYTQHTTHLCCVLRV